MASATPWGRGRNSAGRGISRGRERKFTLRAVGDIVFKVLPEEAVIPNAVKDMVEQCLTGFIAFITRRANQERNYERHLMITTDDIIWAMADLRFHYYVHPLQIYQHKYKNRPQENEPEPEMGMLMQPEKRPRGIPVSPRRRFGDDESPKIRILVTETAENLQDLPALVLRKIY